MALKCPKCGLFNPEGANACDCGYSFLGRAPEVRVTTASGVKAAVVFGTEVSVVDIAMPFQSMVVFMVKWAIASIPAFFILFAIAFLTALLFGSALAGAGGLGSLLKFPH